MGYQTMASSPDTSLLVVKTADFKGYKNPKYDLHMYFSTSYITDEEAKKVREQLVFDKDGVPSPNNLTVNFNPDGRLPSPIVAGENIKISGRLAISKGSKFWTIRKRTHKEFQHCKAKWSEYYEKRGWAVPGEGGKKKPATLEKTWQNEV